VEFFGLHTLVINAKLFKELYDKVKVGRARALIVGLLPSPPSVKRPAPTLVIMVDRVDVGITN
jgi:hypothetical protein